MTMSSKDYRLIARALNIARADLTGDAERYGVQLAAVSIAAALQLDNPRFDRARFLAAVYGD